MFMGDGSSLSFLPNIKSKVFATYSAALLRLSQSLDGSSWVHSDSCLPSFATGGKALTNRKQRERSDLVRLSSSFHLAQGQGSLPPSVEQLRLRCRPGVQSYLAGALKGSLSSEVDAEAHARDASDSRLGSLDRNHSSSTTSSG